MTCRRGLPLPFYNIFFSVFRSVFNLYGISFRLGYIFPHPLPNELNICILGCMKKLVYTCFYKLVFASVKESRKAFLLETNFIFWSSYLKKCATRLWVCTESCTGFTLNFQKLNRTKCTSCNCVLEDCLINFRKQAKSRKLNPSISVSLIFLANYTFSLNSIFFLVLSLATRP